MARQHWGRRLEFFLTTVGFSVGVGDLWRFPYLVMKNGGGAFLIPIVVFNLVGAIPMVYLEMIMGQYSQSGAVSVWSVCPLLKGVGYGTVVATFLFSIYYGVMIGWMLFYFIHSFFNPLPWATCDNSWNHKDTCAISRKAETYVTNFTTTVATSVSSTTSFLSSSTNMSLTNGSSSTAYGVHSIRYETAAEEFWKYKTHRISAGLHEMGDINWPLLGCLLAINVFCFFCIFNGVKLAGKVVYFTVIGPFVLLAVFLIRGVILPGAAQGILYYLTPKPEKLLEPRIWAEACMQVFMSVGPGLGAMITFSSYNKFTNNCMRDAICVCLADLFTGFFGGFVIFSVIGHVSHQTGIPIEQFNQSGYGLGFIMYPEAANYLPPPQLWCALFFFMSIFLGIDSQFPNYEIVITALKDEFPKLFSKRSILLTLAVIVTAFLLAIPQITQGGIYLLTLVDWYAATFSVSVFALLEVIVMTYVYGMDNIEANMKEMTGLSIPVVFKVCWYFLTPALLILTLSFAIFTYAPPAYGGYEYPDWAIVIGWLIAASSLVPIPLYLSYRLYKTPGAILERLRENLRPNSKWGPQNKDTDMETEVIDNDRNIRKPVKTTEENRNNDCESDPRTELLHEAKL